MMNALFNWWRDGFRTATRTGILAGANDAFGVLTDGKVSIDETALLTVEAEEPDDEPPAETPAPAAKVKPKRKTR